MGKYDYNDKEKRINKVLKYNQDMSNSFLYDKDMKDSRDSADDAIQSSMELLSSLGVKREEVYIKPVAQNEKMTVSIRDIDDIAEEADSIYPDDIELEDILSPAETKSALDDLERIENEFSQKTSLVNKTDVAFLVIATAIQTTKALLTPYIAQKFGYGNSADPKTREAHDADSIKAEHRKGADDFRDKHIDKYMEQKSQSANNKPTFEIDHRYKKGYWIEMLYKSVPYDVTSGSKAVLGKGLNGLDHRLKTLGHDPILGWIFGTADILTDVVTLNDFRSFKVIPKPLTMTATRVSMYELFSESVKMIRHDKMNLPAAICSQALHLKSDVYTKQGLPVPIISTINEDFASKLYSEHYDALCFERDMKIIGASAAVSALINCIISLIHGLFYDKNSGISRELYEVRTRKILLISNTIASSSSVIATAITHNPKMLDIGGLLITVTRLFSDIRFIAKVKQEYIDNEIFSIIQRENNELDVMIAELT